jgi:hypothetical protein
MADNKRMVITEVRRNLPDASFNISDILQYSKTLQKIVEQGLGVEMLTPALISQIANEIKDANKKQQLLDAFPQILTGLQNNPFYVTPRDLEEAKKYDNYEDIPLYENTPLTSVEGAVFLDPETGGLVLAPTPNNRIVAPPKSDEGHIGDLTSEDLEVCFAILEDEIIQQRKAQEIPHTLETVTDDGEIGVYGLTVQDLFDANIVSRSAIDAWSAIPDDSHEDYAYKAKTLGLITQEQYDLIPYSIRTTLHWYVLSNINFWLEKAIGPKNFLTLRRIQRLILYLQMLKQWRSIFRYLVLNEITTKSQIAGYLIAQRLLGHRGAQILGAGGLISTALGRLGQDIFNRVFKAIESGVKSTDINKINAESKRVPDPTPFQPKATSKFRLFPNIKQQPSNTPVRVVPQTQGYHDPNKIYPRVSHIGEPDTNRLARNHKIKDTIVGTKNEERILNVEVARKAAPLKWSQPESPYNSKYPYNHVYESESGHVVEYDDTPDNERMHWYHREGTFMEIDRNGTMVRKIVGDGYEVWERDGYIYIGGKANVTIEGNCNIYVKNNVNLQVDGNVTADVHRSVTFNVAKDFNVTAGGTINLKAKENINVQSTRKDININAFNRAAVTGKVVDVFASSVFKTVYPTLGAQPAGTANIGEPPREKNPKEPKFPELHQESKLDEWSNALSTLAEVDDPSTNEEEIKILKKRAVDEGLITPEDLNRPMVEGEKDNSPKPSEKPAKIASCTRIYSVAGDFSSTYTLTKNVTLGSLRGTQNIRAQFGLSVQDIVCNLRQLSENVIEPLYEIIGKKRCINTSAFRYAGQQTGALKPIKGISFHDQGLAVDYAFTVPFKEYYDIAVKLKGSLPHDKLILEYRLGTVKGVITDKPWIHIQWQQSGLTMANNSTGSKARYMSFTMKDDVTYPQPGARQLINLLPNSTLSY